MSKKIITWGTREFIPNGTEYRTFWTEQAMLEISIHGGVKIHLTLLLDGTVNCMIFHTYVVDWTEC